MTANQDALWGIDLGGTKIEGVVLPSADTPRPIARLRVDTGGEKGYDHVLGQIGNVIEALARQTGLTPESIGIGTPGTLDVETGRLRGSNSLHLNDQPVDRDLERRLGLPVRIANDANCFALAETRFGAVVTHHPNARVVFGVILGTGVGGGVVVDGEVLTGIQGIAGEWGHNFLDDSGGECYCGRRGCVETVISGPALESWYARRTGLHRSLADIEARAGQGDAEATATMDRLVRQFGRGIATVINILDPDAVVIGGGVGNIGRLYREGAEEAARHVFSPRMRTRFVAPLLGDSAGVFGAALLVS